MTRHQKRLSVPKEWPVERKTETFTVKAGAGPHGEAGVPLLILLRDVLGYVDSAKEADYALNQGMVLVNGKAVTSPRRPIGMFDILAFTEREEYYRVFPDEGGRLALTPIAEDAAGSKLGKITEKRHVSGGRTQLGLHDGTTIVVEDGGEYAGGDSVVLSNEDKSVVAHFPFREGELVTAVRGQHAGEIGELASIEVTAGSGPNTVGVETDAGEFETIAEYVVVIDENFTDGDGTETDAGDVEDADGEGADAGDEIDADEGDGADAEANEDADADEDADEPDAETDADAGEADEDADDEEVTG